MKAVVLIAVGTLMALVWTGCEKEEHKEVPVDPPTIPRSPAPEFLFDALDGSKIDSAALKGKWVVVNIFATWSPASAREVPEFIALVQSRKLSDFEIVGLSLDENGAADIQPFSERVGLNYPVAALNLSTVRKIFGDIDQIPTTFIIDPEWQYVNKRAGLVGGLSLEAEIHYHIKQAQLRAEGKEGGGHGGGH